MTNSTCPKCQGQLINENGRPVCLQCGHEPLTAVEHRKWYKDSVHEMINDLLANGPEAVEKKWRVKPQMIGHLRLHPHYLKNLKGPTEDTPVRPMKKTTEKQGLPPLPSFNDNWSSEVQVKWLTVWEGQHG